MTSASVRSPKNRFAFLKKDWRLYLMLILPLAQYVLFRYLPMEGVLIAFQKYNLFKGIWGSKYPGQKGALGIAEESQQPPGVTGGLSDRDPRRTFRFGRMLCDEGRTVRPIRSS